MGSAALGAAHYTLDFSEKLKPILLRKKFFFPIFLRNIIFKTNFSVLLNKLYSYIRSNIQTLKFDFFEYTAIYK